MRYIFGRAEDFWGICWEKDSYNIWTQSADLGISCFEFQNGEWIENENLSTPDYIISKYNKEYANDAELQKQGYEVWVYTSSFRTDTSKLHKKAAEISAA